jgi:biotin carboxyl carrier protein
MKQYDNLGVLNINSTIYKTRLSKKYIKRKPYKIPDPYMVYSFIPGTVVDIIAGQGDEVMKGESLLILDAMKMQNHLKAGIDGRVKRINVKKGDKVAKGTLLMELE